MKFKILGLVFILNFYNCTYAQESFNDIDVLGPYPTIGSLEDKQDIDQLLYFQKTRTAEQCALAELEADANLETFFGGSHGLLNANEMTMAKKKLKWLTLKAGAQIYIYKKKFHRPRPYITHPEIKPCIDLEGSEAYPSGHTALARVYARVLSVMFPERGLQFIKRADEVGTNRVLGGVHHPSDIVAGKKLGDALAQDFLGSSDFVSLLED